MVIRKSEQLGNHKSMHLVKERIQLLVVLVISFIGPQEGQQKILSQGADLLKKEIVESNLEPGTQKAALTVYPF